MVTSNEMPQRDSTREALQNNPTTEYLGDGIYATHDGFYTWLQTERHWGWDKIAINPDVYEALNNYIVKMEANNDNV